MNIIVIDACAMIVLQALVVLFLPLVMGREREPYGYSSFISQLIELIMVVGVCGRILGWF